MSAALQLPDHDFEQYIIALAKQHNVSYVETYLDHWADTVTRLGGDEVDADEVQDLLIALTRAGVVTSKDMLTLLVGYLKEKSGKSE